MAEVSPIDLVFWSNILAGAAFLGYVTLMWLQFRGFFQLSPRFLRIVRFFVLCLLLTPIAARYQYSKEAILYLSVAMMAAGLLFKWLRGRGV